MSIFSRANDMDILVQEMHPALGSYNVLLILEKHKSTYLHTRALVGQGEQRGLQRSPCPQRCHPAEEGDTNRAPGLNG